MDTRFTQIPPIGLIKSKYSRKRDKTAAYGINCPELAYQCFFHRYMDFLVIIYDYGNILQIRWMHVVALVYILFFKIAACKR